MYAVRPFYHLRQPDWPTWRAMPGEVHTDPCNTDAAVLVLLPLSQYAWDACETSQLSSVVGAVRLVDYFSLTGSHPIRRAVPSDVNGKSLTRELQRDQECDDEGMYVWCAAQVGS